MKKIIGIAVIAAASLAVPCLAAEIKDFVGTWNGTTQSGTKVQLVISDQGRLDISSFRGNTSGNVKLNGNVLEVVYANGAASFMLKKQGGSLAGQNIVGGTNSPITFSK